MMDVLQFEESDLPDSFKNVIIGSKSDCTEIRSSVQNMNDIDQWVEQFSRKTETSWNVRSSQPHETSRLICSKDYVCTLSNFKKKDPKGRIKHKNFHCPASIHAVVKLTTASTVKKDKFVKDGLPARFSVRLRHSHDLKSAAALGYLKPQTGVRETFLNYFASGLGVTDAIKFHAAIFEHDPDYEASVASARNMPKSRTVSYWYDEWRKHNFGTRIGNDIYELQANYYPNVTEETTDSEAQSGTEDNNEIEMQHEDPVLNVNVNGMQLNSVNDEAADGDMNAFLEIEMQHDDSVPNINVNGMQLNSVNDEVADGDVNAFLELEMQHNDSVPNLNEMQLNSVNDEAADGDVNAFLEIEMQHDDSVLNVNEMQLNPVNDEAADRDVNAYLEALHKCHEKFGTPAFVLQRLTKKLKNVTTREGWETFLCRAAAHTNQGQMNFHRKIPVQTIIPQQRDGVTKGCKHLPAGHPLSEKKQTKKRKINLAENVGRNQANAISH